MCVKNIYDQYTSHETLRINEKWKNYQIEKKKRKKRGSPLS